MATQVVSNRQQNTEAAGPGSKCALQGQDQSCVVVDTDSLTAAVNSSYAGVLLKAYTPETDTNKENVGRVTNSAVISSLKEAMAIGSSPQDEGDSFTTVTSHHSRKQERKKQSAGSGEPRRGNSGVHGRQGDVQSSEGKPNRQQQQPVNGSRQEQQLSEGQPQSQPSSDPMVQKKVFVEAPLPKVNPWQAKRSAAQVLQRQDVNTPQQPAVVRASKDRRKYNAKVSFIFYCASL